METLQDFRLDTTALAELTEMAGEPGSELEGVVPLEWRDKHVLASGRCELRGSLVDLGKISVRATLERRHARLLVSRDVKHLDVSEITSKVRPITQAIARGLFEDGLEGHDDPVAGIIYRSNLDQQTCFALFEGRYEIQPLEAPKPLDESLDELRRACELFRLVLADA